MLAIVYLVKLAAFAQFLQLAYAPNNEPPDNPNSAAVTVAFIPFL
jgi:hypothetical protein